MEQLLGNPNKARTELGWNPSKTSFNQLIKLMVNNDLDYVDRENRIRREFD